MRMEQGAGRAFWIDHYTIPTNDLARAIDFHERVLGAKTDPSEEMRRRGRLFQYLARCHQGLFAQSEQLPEKEALGKGYPRYALFVRPEDLDQHLRRLDANRVEHSGAVRTSAEGEAGTAVYWHDVDGNQHEFWAPEHMPPGAMEGCGAMNIGRISHAVYASRDLRRTAEFFKGFCALLPLESADIGADTLVLPLAAGARLVFKLTHTPGLRTSGHGIYHDLHTALAVREQDFWPNYERIWNELPEWDYEMNGQYTGDGARLPARTTLHRSPAGRAWKARFGRGDDWFDWDTNMFHFVGGEPEGASMAVYRAHTIDHYMEAYLATHSRGPDRGTV